METVALDSIFSRRPIATGIAVGVASLIPHFFVSPAMSLAFAAILLGMVAGVYFGFAVTSGNNVQQQIEFNVSFLFAIAALLGFGIARGLSRRRSWRMGFGISLITTASIRASSLFPNGTFRGAWSSTSSSASGLL